MATDVNPILGNWYKHLDKGHEFQVVAFDEDTGVVEIQHHDGDVDAMDLDDWYRMEIEAIEPPEDWTGPVDDAEHDDMGYSETDMSERDWEESDEEWAEEEDEYSSDRDEDRDENY